MLIVPAGKNILNFLREKSFFISSPCNGIGKCGKCKIKILSPYISPLNREKQVLSNEEIDNGIRLACLHNTIEDTIIEFIQLKSKMIIADNVMDLIEKKSYIKIKNNVIYRNEEQICNGNKAFGIIMDIGTTTCVMVLVDLITGQMLDSISFINPQTSHGHDVISRIGFASNPIGLSALHQLIVDTTNKNMSILLDDNNITHSSLMEIVVAGNSTMNHLYINVDPSTMATAPYSPKFISKQVFNAKKLYNQANNFSLITVLPGFDAFVGSDILSGVYALDMIQSENYQLLIDLGTNGEIVLGNKNGLFATSTAAGPAFEGINISCGIGAIDGALSVFNMTDKNHYTFDTIASKPCIGICGSGLIDIIASLKKQGIINSTGYMKNDFMITKDIFITPKDVREVQLAKAAIRAGIDVLINHSNISLKKIENVYVSGGFGKYADINNIIDIGIIPKELSEKIVIVGNSSLSGAYKYVMSKDHEDIDRIINRTKVIRLDANPRFMEAYINFMSF